VSDDYRRQYARGLRVRYSRQFVSREEIESFVRALDANRGTDRYEPTAMVFADRLDETGDPRGEVIRSHFARSGSLGSRESKWVNLYDEDGRRYGTFSTTKSPRRVAIAIDFKSAHTPEYADDARSDPHLFAGYFHPTDARRLAGEFPEEHRPKVLAFLDRHYPTEPDTTPLPE
jgi:hypothetical protein